MQRYKGYKHVEDKLRILRQEAPVFEERTFTGFGESNNKISDVLALRFRDWWGIDNLQRLLFSRLTRIQNQRLISDEKYKKLMNGFDEDDILDFERLSSQRIKTGCSWEKVLVFDDFIELVNTDANDEVFAYSEAMAFWEVLWTNKIDCEIIYIKPVGNNVFEEQDFYFGITKEMEAKGYLSAKNQFVDLLVPEVVNGKYVWTFEKNEDRK